MDLYEAFRRRMCRDFTDEPVNEATLQRILGEAFYVPTNDQLRQFEFVVVRGHGVAV